MKLSKIYRNLLIENSINEARAEYSHLPPTTILVDNGGALTLYDTTYYKSDEPIEGVLGFIALSFYNTIAEVEIVGAKKGFGPMMYELAMQHSTPTPLVSSREGDTKEGALRVWEYFLKGNNPDVNVVTLTPENEEYQDCLEWGCHDTDPEFFKIYNSRFYMEESSEFLILLENGEDFHNSVKDSRNIITNLGRNFFDGVY